MSGCGNNMKAQTKAAGGGFSKGILLTFRSLGDKYVFLYNLF